MELSSGNFLPANGSIGLESMTVKQTNRFRKWWLLASVVLVLGFCTLHPSTAKAEGSRDLYPTDPAVDCVSATGPQFGFADPTNFCRANLEWRTSFYGPSGSQIARRTLLKVFARPGEVILTGSSAMGVVGSNPAISGDIVIYPPGVVTGAIDVKMYQIQANPARF